MNDAHYLVTPPTSDSAAIARRRQLVALAKRRAQSGSGSSVAFLAQRGWVEPAMNLRQIQTPFVIVGGVATCLYMPIRATLDIDLLVRTADAAQISRELGKAGATPIGRLGSGKTHWRLPDESTMDVLELDDPWVEEALGAPNRGPTGLPVIALPYLILMKLLSSRAQDVADMSRMLGQATQITRDAVRDVIRRYRPEDLADLESLIALGDLELRET